MEENENKYKELAELTEILNYPDGKRKVILSAINMFSHKGFSATSTAEIARNAGVSEAIIFKYFGSKRNLMIELVKPVIKNLFPDCSDNYFEDIKKQNYNLKELTLFMVNDRVKFFSRYSDILLIILNEILVDDEVLDLFEDVYSEEISEYSHRLYHLFNETGELSSEITHISLIRNFVGQLIVHFVQQHRFSITLLDSYEVIANQIYKSIRK